MYAQPMPLTQALCCYTRRPLRPDELSCKNMAELRAQCTTPWVGPSSQSQLWRPLFWVFFGHLFLVRHFIDFQECPVPGVTFKGIALGIARPNPSADRRAKSNTDSPRRVGPVLDFATENKDPHFSMNLGPQYGENYSPRSLHVSRGTRCFRGDNQHCTEVQDQRQAARTHPQDRRCRATARDHTQCTSAMA